MIPKEFRGLVGTGISVRDELCSEPKLCNKKYQVNIKLSNGTVRYLYLDNPHVAELYVTIIGATILKTRKL